MAKQVIHRITSRWSEIFICTAIGLGPLNFVCFSSAQAAQARSAIESAQIVAAMRDASLPVEGVQVKLAAAVTSSVPMPRLEVTGGTLAGSREAHIRLACVERSECLPFYATAIYVDAVDADKFRFGRDGQAAALQSSSKLVALKNGGSLPKAVDAKKDIGVLRAGASASLEFEADKIHVRIEVISLQNGAAGDRVRVSSLDHKQIYMAQVITPTLLKGEFLQ